MAQELEQTGQIDAAALQAELEAGAANVEDLKDRAAKAERSGNPAMKAQAADLRRQAAELEAEADDVPASAKAALQQAAERAEQTMGLRLLGQVSEDLATTPVQDTVINARDFHAVLTMSGEFFTDATRAHLRAGVFRAVGKVTRILGEDDELNLLRRTVLGAAEPEIGRNLITSAVEEGNLQLETFDPIINPPAVQVLPLAVFV